jgi:hypothetical protein
MQVFVQVSLGQDGFYVFKQPVLQKVKEQFPEVITLDVDAASDEMLVTQACRLVQEAKQAVIYFKVIEPQANLGAGFRVVEEIIRTNKPILILIEGNHARLASILKVRPHLMVTPVSEGSNIFEHLTAYFRVV